VASRFLSLRAVLTKVERREAVVKYISYHH
jgi:hypothetical protein